MNIAYLSSWSSIDSPNTVWYPEFTEKYDIPFCPTTATHIPVLQVNWEEAKQIHKKHITKKEYNYHENAFVNWYLDDYKFDGVRGIWHDFNFALEVELKVWIYVSIRERSLYP